MFRTPILTSDTIKDITVAAAALHNNLRCTSRDSYTPPDLLILKTSVREKLEGKWRQNPHGAMEGLPVVARGHFTDAKEIRERLKLHFNHEGQVPCTGGYISSDV